jgi:SAM-dependent methyltransferase
MPDPETRGSNYVDHDGAKSYAQARHGIDGAQFLDPIFTDHMRTFCPDNIVLDAGCGAAPWAIFAAELGANSVLAIDNSEAMYGQARKALNDQPGSIKNAVGLVLADVQEVPSDRDTFDVALSINVGCALPSNGAFSESGFAKKVGPLEKHFIELARVLKPGGHAIVTSPASLEVPFTTYGEEDDKIQDLKDDLSALTGESADEMKKVVGGKDEILRATIVQQGDRWKLIEHIGTLGLGEFIYRKIPGLVVPNYNHDRSEYIHAMRDAGLAVPLLSARRLTTGNYSQEVGLGWQYKTSNPFDVFLARA